MQHGAVWDPAPEPPLAYQPAFAWGPVHREFVWKKVVTKAAKKVEDEKNNEREEGKEVSFLVTAV